MRTSDLVSWLTEVEKKAPGSSRQQPSHRRAPRSGPTPPPENTMLVRKRQRTQSEQDDGSEQDGSEHVAGYTYQVSHPAAPRSSTCSSRLPDEGFVQRSLTDDSEQPPPQLAAMRSQLMSTARGNNILGAATKDAFVHCSTHHPDLERFTADSERFFSTQRDHLGPTPSPEEVLHILESANECSEFGLGKSGWNNEVHHPLLCMALRRRQLGCTFKSLTKIVPCTGATLMKEYKPQSALDVTIDYCLCINGKYDEDEAEDLASLRSLLPLFSINVTCEPSLLAFPIAVPIVTRRPGEGWDDAASQIGLWLVAHLNLLRWLAHQARSVSGEEPDPELEDVGFFPGLIVQGHDWYFVAANREGDETVIWSKILLGATSDITGIYQIVTALQILRKWTLNVYWKWLKNLSWYAEMGMRRDK